MQGAQLFYSSISSLKLHSLFCYQIHRVWQQTRTMHSMPGRLPSVPQTVTLMVHKCILRLHSALFHTHMPLAVHFQLLWISEVFLLFNWWTCQLFSPENIHTEKQNPVTNPQSHIKYHLQVNSKQFSRIHLPVLWGVKQLLISKHSISI